MSQRIGMEIRDRRIAAVLVGRRGMVRAVQGSWGPDDRPLSQAVTDVLRALLPGWRYRRRSIDVAFGLTGARIRRIEGLPPAGSRVLNGIVAENPDRFFVRTFREQVMTAVRTDAVGSHWAAVIDGTRIKDTAAAIAHAGCRLRRVLPVGEVLGAALAESSGSADWSDGGRAASFTYCHRILTDIDDVHGNGTGGPWAEDLATLEDGDIFAAAYGAAKTDVRSTSLAVYPERGHSYSSRRTRVAAVTAAAAVIVAVLGPGASAALAVRRDRRELKALQPAYERAALVHREVEQFNRALNQISGLRERRLRPLTFLSALSDALPGHSAILSLSLDSLSGSLVALTPDAGRAVEELERAFPQASWALVGSVTTEVKAGVEVERLMLQFRMPPFGPPVAR